jgi:hypothetical protein
MPYIWIRYVGYINVRRKKGRPKRRREEREKNFGPPVYLYFNYCCQNYGYTLQLLLYTFVKAMYTQEMPDFCRGKP